MRSANSLRPKSLLFWSISAFVCIFIRQSATAAQQTGSIVGWGSQVVGVDLDGGFVAWGSNGSGECNIPSPNADFIAVAAGTSHSLGLKKDCLYLLAGDLNDHCKVGFPDFSSMAANWLIDCHTDPNNPACIPK